MKTVKTIDNQRLSIEFIMHEHGWAALHFTLNDHVINIDLSDVIDPFADIVGWIDDIALGRLPATITIDEEGHVMTLTIRPNDTQTGWVWLSVTGSRGDSYLQVACDRQALNHKLRLELLRFFRHTFNPTHWGLHRTHPLADGDDVQHMVLTHTWAHFCE